MGYILVYLNQEPSGKIVVNIPTGSNLETCKVSSSPAMDSTEMLRVQEPQKQLASTRCTTKKAGRALEKPYNACVNRVCSLYCLYLLISLTV